MTSKLRRLVRDYLERDGFTVLGSRRRRGAALRWPPVRILTGDPRLGCPPPGEEVARLLRKTSDVPLVMRPPAPTMPTG